MKIGFNEVSASTKKGSSNSVVDMVSLLSSDDEDDDKPEEDVRAPKKAKINKDENLALATGCEVIDRFLEGMCSGSFEEDDAVGEVEP
jgi:hypothetical protein